jgi:hypothetical protein
MKKIIFVLTYSEGEKWCEYYRLENDAYKNCFPDDYLLVFLDNGNQDSIKNWANATNSIYFRSTNNLGTTGGYNWFMRIGQLLKAPRIAVMQADVVIHNPIVVSRLFNQENGDEWNSEDFVYWPNDRKSAWRSDGVSTDCGQFFSIDPTFFIENDYLCDENYTVTHFESIDLFLRISDRSNNNNPAVFRNLAYMYYPDKDVVNYQTHEYNEDLLYTLGSYSNRLGEHDPWFIYNFPYFQKKWMESMPTIDPVIGKKLLFNEHSPVSLWGGSPWCRSEKMMKWRQLLIHRKPLNPHRNIEVGQLPYPVEWEVNRFYLEFVKDGQIVTFLS